MIKNTNGIQEVSGSIPLISTIEALKTIGLTVIRNKFSDQLSADGFRSAYEKPPPDF